VKCPACGFETPDEQAWCDFCKEPLRKRRPAAAPAAAAPQGESVPPAKTVPVPDEVWKKLMSVRAEGTPASAPSGGIPAEFAGLDTGGALPAVPPAVRKGAWVFLGICVLWIFFAIFWMIRHSDRIASNVSTTTPLPTRDSAPAPETLPEASSEGTTSEPPPADVPPPDTLPPNDGGTL